jgi:hypothetical protein
MNITKFSILLVAVFLLTSVPSQAQDRSTGGIKGKVRVESGSPEGVSVVVRQGEREVSRHLTDKGGSFLIQRLPPGIYGLTFRKPGLSVGTVESLEVKAGKTRSLGDRLILTIDEGSIAFLRGSVFNEGGRSVRGVRVELAKIQEDGSAKKIDSRVSNESGSFVFRLKPEAAKYRVTAKPNGLEPVARDVEVEGAAVYRVALTFPPSSRPSP